MSNETDTCFEFLYSKISSATNCKIYNGTAPKDAPASHVCFSVTNGRDYKAIGNVRIWTEFTVSVRIWDTDDYKYEDFSNICHALDGVTGETFTNGYIQSCIRTHIKTKEEISEGINYYACEGIFKIRIK